MSDWRDEPDMQQEWFDRQEDLEGCGWPGELPEIDEAWNEFWDHHTFQSMPIIVQLIEMERLLNDAA